MSFNSLEFLIFVLIFYFFFRFVRYQTKWQHLALAFFSFIFYAFGDLSYLPVLIGVGAFNYFFGHFLHQNPRLLPLAFGISLNLGLLIWGKFNFGQQGHLPLGISFYTFQAICYLVDIRRKEASLPVSFWHFQSYLFFFPQLLAGPICRSGQLMEQLKESLPLPSPESIRSGMYLLSFGLLKKAVIADAIGLRVDQSFQSFTTINDPLSWALIIFAFGWQIYFDFSGYTDMARGMAKLFGVKLPHNFNFPYFSRSPKEFWSRWHITLSQWFRDYIYIPLGGSRNGTRNAVMAILISFTLSALWHGVGMNYILWGLWHALALLLFRYQLKKIPAFASATLTLFIINFGWIFFRARENGQLIHILGTITNFSNSSFFILWNQYQDLIILSTLAVLIDFGAHAFKRHYPNLRPALSDSVWALVTFFALIFQAPIKQFIYFRF